MQVETQLIVYGVIAYFIGNISPSILIGKLYGVDIKKEGSGNAGTTNVLRVLGAKAAAATLLIDVLKGYIAVLIGLNTYGDLGAMVCFVCVVYGHIFPVFFKFKGGKGVATSFGAALAVDWLSAFALLLIAVAVAGTTRKMSLGSILAAVAYPFLVWYYYPDILPVSIIMACTVIIMHRGNIKRLIRHEEPSLHFGSHSKIESDDSVEENEPKPNADILARRMIQASDASEVVEGRVETEIIDEIVKDEFGHDEPDTLIEEIGVHLPQEDSLIKIDVPADEPNRVKASATSPSEPIHTSKTSTIKKPHKSKDDKKHIVISDANGNAILHITAKEIKDYNYHIEQKG